MGKYVRWSLGTAAHRRHHQEKRAECTFASTSRGGRQPREREKKKSKQIALSHLCVYPYAHRVYHVFFRLWLYLMLTSVESGGIFFSRKWIEMCDVTQSKSMEPLLAIVWGQADRLSNHHLSVCPLRWGIIFEILLRFSGVEWPTVTAAVVTFKDESALYVFSFFPTDNKLLASGEIHSSSSIGNYTFDTTGNDKVITL
jgi:hypothetical protein